MTDTYADDIHPAHADRKMAMALRIGDQIMEKGGPLATSEALAEAGDVTWGRIAFLLDEVRVPSPATRAMVVAYLRHVEKREAEAKARVDKLVATLSATFGDNPSVRVGTMEDFIKVLTES